MKKHACLLLVLTFLPFASSCDSADDKTFAGKTFAYYGVVNEVENPNYSQRSNGYNYYEWLHNQYSANNIDWSVSGVGRVSGTVAVPNSVVTTNFGSSFSSVPRSESSFSDTSSVEKIIETIKSASTTYFSGFFANTTIEFPSKMEGGKVTIRNGNSSSTYNVVNYSSSDTSVTIRSEDYQVISVSYTDPIMGMPMNPQFTVGTEIRISFDGKIGKMSYIGFEQMSTVISSWRSIDGIQESATRTDACIIPNTTSSQFSNKFYSQFGLLSAVQNPSMSNDPNAKVWSFEVASNGAFVDSSKL